MVLLGAACSGVARPQGWAQPELQQDVLYVSLEHGKLDAYRQGNPPQRLWEFPAKDARVPLVVRNGEPLRTPQSAKINFEGLYGDPVVTGDGVYATAYSGHVVALTTDGTARWVAELPGRMIGGALVVDDTVYAGSTGGDLYALAKDSGAVRWRRPAGKEVWAAPVRAGDLIAVSGMDGALRGFDRDGTQRWKANIADAGIASTPAVDGTRLFAGSFDRHMYAVDARTGEMLWKSAPADSWFWTEVLVQGDTVFAGSLGGTVYAFDAATGAVKWSTRVGDSVRSRPALVSDVLVVGSRDGRLHGLRPEDGSRVWDVSKSPAPEDPTATRGDLYADLLPAGNGVYATTEGGRSAGHIYFLDVSARRVSEIPLR